MVDQLHSFRTRLLALIVGVMAGTLGLVELQGLNKEARDLQVQLRDQAQRTIELQAKALSTPVWNLDKRRNTVATERARSCGRLRGCRSSGRDRHRYCRNRGRNESPRYPKFVE